MRVAGFSTGHSIPHQLCARPREWPEVERILAVALVIARPIHGYVGDSRLEQIWGHLGEILEREVRSDQGLVSRFMK